MSNPIDILIIGFGAVGTIYGYILSQNANVRVTAIARSSYDAMQGGIRIESDKFGLIPAWKPYRLVRDAAAANDRTYTYIIATFKCLPDLLPSAEILAPFLDAPHGKKQGSTGPTVVLIQNGIGIEQPVQVAYPNTPIISVVAWIGANLLPNGTVTHGTLEKLVFGLYLGEGQANAGSNPDPEEAAFSDPAKYHDEGGAARREHGWKMTNQLELLLNAGGGGTEVVKDIQVERYKKNLWNAAWSSICALSRSAVSAVVAPAVLPFTLPVVRRTMLEVLYIAREYSYSEDVLPMKSIDDAIKITIQNYQVRPAGEVPGTPYISPNPVGGYGFPANGASASDSAPMLNMGNANFKPSMLLDIEAGRPCELEPIIGSLLDRARAKGVETPRLDVIYAALKVYQDAAIRRSTQSETYSGKSKVKGQPIPIPADLE